MNYYPFHIGDYLSNTSHLELMEDLAYRRLIDLYYSKDGNVMAVDAARLIRMKLHEKEVNQVISEFFVIDESGKLCHVRCDIEISKAIEKSTKARISAGLSHSNRKASAKNESSERRANAERTQSECFAPNIQEPRTNTQEPIPKNHKPNNSNELLNTLPRELVSEFLSIRKTKKQPPPTERAMNQIAKEAETAGITLLEAITACCDYGWASFKADWYAGKTNNKPAAMPNMKNGKPVLDREGWTAQKGEGWYTPWGTREGWHDGVFFENDCEMMGAAA